MENRLNHNPNILYYIKLKLLIIFFLKLLKKYCNYINQKLIIIDKMTILFINQKDIDELKDEIEKEFRLKP